MTKKLREFQQTMPTADQVEAIAGDLEWLLRELLKHGAGDQVAGPMTAEEAKAKLKNAHS